MPRAIPMGTLFALLFGCAPLAMLRPAGVPKHAEVGGGIAALAPRPFVEEPWHAAAQFWGTVKTHSWLELSVVLAFDDAALAAGIAVRAYFLSEDRLRCGAEFEVGWAWAAAGMACGGRTSDEVWIYTAPRIGFFGLHLTPTIPLGLDLHIPEHFSMRAEAALSWEHFKSYNRRFHAAFGLSYQDP